MASKGIARVKTKLRFGWSKFDAPKMRAVADAVHDSVLSRILQGRNEKDGPAKPLTNKWAKKKRAKGLFPRRDLVFSGRMMAAFQVRQAGDSRAKIGFVNGLAAAKAAQNNKIEPMTGMSRKNRADFRKKVRELAKVEVKRG